MDGRMNDNTNNKKKMKKKNLCDGYKAVGFMY